MPARELNSVRKLGTPSDSQATKSALRSVGQPARLPTTTAGAKNVRTRQLLALATTKAPPPPPSPSPPPPPPPPPRSAPRRRVAPPKPPSVAVVDGARTLWGSRVVEALTMRPAPSRPPRPGT
ncbi:unnamed protein product [Closterium sp. NIES-53]